MAAADSDTSSDPARPRPKPIFRKAETFTDVEEHEAMGLYPFFRPISSAQDTEVTIRGKKMIMLGSNSYMGLTNDPRIKEASRKALEKYGSGCAGSRFLNGTLDLHIELEEQLADFMEKEAALAFTTGFQANLGAISAIVGKNDEVLIDRSDHASIVDGCRLSFGKMRKFKHNDMRSLERVLETAESKNRLIVVDGVYSMEGDIAPVPDLVEIGNRYGAALLVDDAHGIGVLGSHGQGTCAHFGMTDEVDLIVGTFSKSLATIGGFVAGSRQVINFLKHHARALIFSASMAPACAAAAMKAMEIIRSEPERREMLWKNTYTMLNGLKEMGFNTGTSETPIIPVIVGENQTVFLFWRALQDAGIFVNPVISPATPPGQALVRVSVMATHTESQLSFALDTFNKIGKEMGLLPVSA